MGDSFRTRIRHASNARHRANPLKRTRGAVGRQSHTSASLAPISGHAISLYNGLPALCMALSSTAKIFAINRFGAQLLGVAQATAVGRNATVWLEDTDRARFLQQLDACARSAIRVVHLNCTFVHRLGRLIQIRGTIRQAPELGPGTIALVGTMVVDRVGDPSGLLDRYLQQAVDSSTDWACIYDVEGQQIAFVGKLLAATVGRQPEELQGEKWRSCIHPQDRAQFVHHLRECIDAPSEQRGIEFRVRDAGGGWRWWSSRNRGFKAPQGRRLQGFVLGTVSDITARKQAELSLQNRIQQEQLLRGIAEKIYQSLDLDRILKTSVEEVRHLLDADWVTIYRWVDERGTVLVESRLEGHPSLLENSDLEDSVDRKLCHESFVAQLIRKKE